VRELEPYTSLVGTLIQECDSRGGHSPASVPATKGGKGRPPPLQPRTRVLQAVLMLEHLVMRLRLRARRRRWVIYIYICIFGYGVTGEPLGR